GRSQQKRCLSMEGRRVHLRRCDYRSRCDLAATASVRLGAANGCDYPGNAMNMLASLQPILADLRERFGPRIEEVHARRPNEIYVHAKMELVAGFCAQLYKKWNGRLVSLFADDVRDHLQPRPPTLDTRHSLVAPQRSAGGTL